jgi:hypothetical protein
MPGDPARVEDLLKLKEIWEDLGLTVRAMEGWRHRGRDDGNTFEVLGIHHTAAAGDIDSTLRNGRPGVEGPLCNVALHKNGDVILVASGLANHFGCATWPNGKSLGVEATGPQPTGVKYPNRDAYELLAVGFCIFKGNADPRKVVKSDVGIPVHLVAAHKEVGMGRVVDGKVICDAKVYGRKPVDPDFEDSGPLKTGTLSHGFSVTGSGIRLIDAFRAQVHARMTAAAAPFPGELTLNATNAAAVKVVQKNLNRFLPAAEKIPENGRFDVRTRDKLTAWQKARRIQESSQGKVGPGTWQMLHAPNFSQTLKLNSTGKAVQQLKVALNKYPPNALDTSKPKFDPDTEKVVKNWQSHRGQRVDGVVDMLTWFWIHTPSGRPPKLHP